MGLNPLWQEDVFLTVQALFPQTKLACAEPHYIIDCNSKFFIHLVPLNTEFKPTDFIALQTDYQNKSFQLVHLWEDVWHTKRTQVLSRIHSFLGLNKSFHGRKAKVVLLNQKETADFLTAYHLQGYVKAKYNFGLMAEDQLIAAASFSEARPMKSKGVDYQSAELVRFASKDRLTVVGGLSKLIKHFTKQVQLNDLMTYADRDWSLGKGYDKLGFTHSETTEPSFLCVDPTTMMRYFPHRLPATADESKYLKAFNTGNLKYHLYL